MPTIFTLRKVRRVPPTGSLLALNAKAVTAFFNTAGNWGNGSGADQTENKAGQSLASSTTELTVLGNGSSGSPVLITFQPNAQIRIPACDNTNGCIDLNGASYITIDGGTACGPGTACATTAMACASSPGSCGTASIVQTSSWNYFLYDHHEHNLQRWSGHRYRAKSGNLDYRCCRTLSPSRSQVTAWLATMAHGRWFRTTTATTPSRSMRHAAARGPVDQQAFFAQADPSVVNNQDAIILNAQGGCANCEVRNLILGPLGFRTSYQDVRNVGAVGTIYFTPDVMAAQPRYTTT